MRKRQRQKEKEGQRQRRRETERERQSQRKRGKKVQIVPVFGDGFFGTLGKLCFRFPRVFEFSACRYYLKIVYKCGIGPPADFVHETKNIAPSVEDAGL